MDRPLHVTSEIGPLRSVLLKRPGKELENLVPDYLSRLLFDDIPFLPVVQKEHDAFAEVLRSQGSEVLYLETLTKEVFDTDAALRGEFVDRILAESRQTVSGQSELVREYLMSLGNQDLVDTIMAGVRRIDLDAPKTPRLQDMMAQRSYPFYLDPMPNLYFTRDPAASMGNGLTINHMSQEARQRESLFMEYIIKHHPRFAKADVSVWLDRNQDFSIEGGDELVISSDTVAIGVSQRTTPNAIEMLARNLFATQDMIKRVVAIEIPESRAFMHLDTVFTMVNYNQFTIHPAIQDSTGELNVYIIEQDNSTGDLKIKHRRDLQQVLKEVLHQEELDLIPCGGGDEITAAREQWNDGSNTLAVAPGVVVTYDRNTTSNELMRAHGITVHECVGSELVRGRGGPRCMSMPLVREDI